MTLDAKDGELVVLWREPEESGREPAAAVA